MARAAISYSDTPGSINPANPNDWTDYTNGRIGDSVDGWVTVDDESDLLSSYSYLGYNAGITGEMTVTGTGSKWTTGGLEVGHYGSGILNIEAGGQVSSYDNGYLDYYSGATGTATVTGTDSQWISSSNLYVGHEGGGTLNIEAGGQVSNYDGCLGRYSGSTGAATVTGTDSKWTNSGNLHVGREGSGTLTVSDGGTVTARTLWASQSDLYGNGAITTKGAVLDADLIFDAVHGPQPTLAFGAGGTLKLDLDGTGHLGAGYKSAGTLRIADGVTVACTTGYLGDNSSSTGAATVTGTGSKWTHSEDLYVGRHGNGTLNIEAGGQVSNENGCLGRYSSSTGTATVTGTGSKWANSGNLHVGRDGNGTLTVSDGGVVTAGTLWAALSDLYGNGVITAKGAVLDADLIIDAAHGPQPTLAFGAGGTLNLDLDGTGQLGAGYKSAGTLRIADGVTVACTTGYLGYHPGSTGTATVTGTGSKWTNSEDLYVGRYGSGTLNIEAGGQVSNDDGYVGWSSGCTGTATVTGTGSKWTNSEDLYVGRFGDSSSLNIQAGGQVSNHNGYLGYYSGSTGTATVTGTGSKWTNSENLYVGRDGSGTLTVSDGGAVTARTLWASLSDLYGNGAITAKGTVLDDDLIIDAAHGSQPTLAFGTGGTLNLDLDGTGHLGAGYKSAGTLRIADGATVVCSTGYLGYLSGSTGTATVTGTDSKWTSSSELYVGYLGTGALNIEAGGQVSNDNGYLGLHAGCTGTATVTGTGSKWTNSGNLYVGRYGIAELKITGGGLVSVAEALAIDTIDSGDSFINMATGGMLAVAGNADDSLIDFYSLIAGTDAIRWWDDSVNDWALLTTATLGADYWLDYLDDGDLSGYTLLTVGTVPEPGALTLLLCAGLLSVFVRIWQRQR